MRNFLQKVILIPELLNIMGQTFRAVCLFRILRMCTMIMKSSNWNESNIENWQFTKEECVFA